MKPHEFTVPGHFTCEKTPEATTIHVYGSIGSTWIGDGVQVDQFVREVDAIEGGRVDVYVNSPGGDAFGGLAMMNALRRCKGQVTVTVDGLAASAASYVALGGDRLVMGRNSQMMIHDASGVCVGNASEMDKMRTALDKLSDNIASIYAGRSGRDIDQWREAMRTETWLSADEALAAGLADEVDAAIKEAPSDELLGFFNHAGRQAAPAPSILSGAVASHNPPAAEPGNPTGKDTTMSTDLIAGLRDRLGIPADTDPSADTILSALDEALAERAEQAAAPEGTVLIDAVQLDELKTAAAEGATARAQQVAEARTRMVDEAIEAGKIPPARRDHWLASAEADEEGTRAVLGSLAAGTIPTDPIGYTGGVDEASDDDKLYADIWGEN